MLTILADENIPSMTIETLRTLGHDVLDIRGTPLEGSADSKLWDLGRAQERLLITTDKGFARRRHEAHHGILIVRLRQPNRQRIHDRVLQTLARFPPGNWAGRLVVVRDTVLTVWQR